MITRMTVENFKALRHVDVDLAPFTVLVGPNDAGKSSFLEGVYALGESTRSELRYCFWSPWRAQELVYQQNSATVVRFAATLDASGSGDGRAPPDSEAISYELSVVFKADYGCEVADEKIGFAASTEREQLPFQIGTTQTSVNLHVSSQASIPQRVRELLQQVKVRFHTPALARWDIEELGSASRLQPDRKYPFDPSGYGLATCIAEMKLANDRRFAALRDEFCLQFPAFRDIMIKRTTVTSVERSQDFKKQQGSQGEGYALLLITRDGMEIPAALASGGVLVALAFLTLVHLPEPRKLLLVEEPENGLHPARLKEVVQILRQSVERQKDCQVILTTHSPLLLDYVKPEELRVFLRTDKGDIEAHNVADLPDIEDRLKHLLLGELVYNEGEEELVKEIREHARPVRR